MPLNCERSLVITLEESLLFAEASGDFNPLHVDPIAARRTQFGGTVVHGIHALLRSLDVIIEHQGWSEWAPLALTATFSNPIHTGTSFTVRWTVDADQQRVRVSAEVESRPAFSLTIASAANPRGSTPTTIPTSRWSVTTPREVDFPPETTQGEVPVAADPALLTRLLPTLSGLAPPAWVADLMASTRIVGMECPGLHSIYSGLKLRRIENASPGDVATMQFELERLDPRFRLSRLRIRGSQLEGTLDTFFRPPPVQQPTLAEIAERVRPDEFAGQRALVIGGSRGLGETAAKVLLAGGAEVTITFAHGKADAERVVEEARRAGHRCDSQRLDVTASAEEFAARSTDTDYTHAYFFASPHIEKNSTGRWNQAAFQSMSDFYVRGFAALVEALGRSAAGRPSMRWFYPSTVFLDSAEPGFAEYCAAKSAGEAIAGHLARTNAVRISTPRLPRMRTDQTSGLIDVPMNEPSAVLLEAFRAFCA